MKAESWLILAGGIAAFVLLNKATGGGFGEGMGRAMGEGAVEGTSNVIEGAWDWIKGFGGTPIIEGKTETHEMLITGSEVQRTIPTFQISDLIFPWRYGLKQVGASWQDLKANPWY